MEKNKKRAERRTHKERKRHKLERMIEHRYSDPSMRWNGFDQWKEEFIRKHADNPACCSCYSVVILVNILMNQLYKRKKFVNVKDFVNKVDYIRLTGRECPVNISKLHDEYRGQYNNTSNIRRYTNG